ncbi:MAG: DUF3370 domain-containing protein [Cyanobacteria bacterium J06627_28]
MFVLLTMLLMVQEIFGDSVVMAHRPTNPAEQATPQLTAQVIAQATETAEPVEIVTDQQVRPLPGQLDDVPVFNSNSPELVADPGILLSTFPANGMASPEAHLDFVFDGRFDIFAHHVYKAADYDEEEPVLLDSMYVGILVHNPGDEPVTLRILDGASYVSQPDAPFIPLPDFVPFSRNNPVYSGPGSRGMGDMLQGLRQDIFEPTVTIAPGESEMVLNHPINIRELVPPINGRSTLMHVESSGPVYVASLAQEVGIDENGEETPPSVDSWMSILKEGSLAGPRDRTPAPLPLEEGVQLIYGRVAGVSQGSQWRATLTDLDTAPGSEAATALEASSETAEAVDEMTAAAVADATEAVENFAETALASRLTIPAVGEAFSYGISLLYAGTMGTGQNQSAEMLVRYPDTAYESHGNYGVRYSLTLPLYNSTNEEKTVTVALETAIKEDDLSEGGLRFFEPLPPQTFFRGPVQVRYSTDNGIPRIRNIHLVMRRGQQGTPLVEVTLAPQSSRTVDVDLLYPADSTPPQVLTVRTVE